MVSLEVWLSDYIVVRINEVAQHRAGLVLRWVTAGIPSFYSGISAQMFLSALSTGSG